jgi:hypothetical protein
LGGGTDTVSATFNGDDSNHTAATGTLSQVVNQAANTVTFTTAPPASAEYGSTFTVAASGQGTGAISYTSDGVYCTNSGAMYTVIAAGGGCTVTATQAADSNYESASATASVSTTDANSSVSVASSGSPSVYGQSVTFTATITSDTGAVKGRKPSARKPKVVGGTVTWSDNTGCGTTAVTSGYPGTATCTTSVLGAGTDTVSATYNGDDSNHTTGTASVSQVVNQATATVVLSNLSQTYTGSALSPTVTTTPAGLNVTLTGAPQTNAGSYSVTATVNNSNYAGSASGTFVIGKASQTLSFTTAPPATAQYGSHFTVAAKSSAGLAPFYTSSGICDNVGTTYTVLANTGTCTVIVEQAGNANYAAAANLTASVTATELVPVISWGTPAAVAYGTKLSKTQLDATASYNGVAVKGTFTYSPAMGTALPAGSNTLSVTFTPTSTATYATATDTVTLVVTPIGSTTAVTSIAPASPKHGVAATVHFKVTAAYGHPTGTVTVTSSSGETCSGALTNGTGTCSITFAAAGSDTLTAAYSGDNNDTASSSASFPVTVK